MSADQYIGTAAVAFAGLATGGLMINWVGLGRAMLLMRSASGYVEFHQATNATFDPYMPAVVIGSVLADVALAVVSDDSGSARIASVVGALGYAAVLVISLLTNVRINTEIARWRIDDPPDTWRDVRRRWVRFHVLRTALSLVPFGATVLAVSAW